MSAMLGPFQITQGDIEHTSLEQHDLGKWALLVTGCYQIFESQEAAYGCVNYLNSNGGQT